MNIPKAKKLPSGNWRIQIMVNGKRYSITDKDAKSCKQRAKEIYAGFEYEEHSALTLGDAIDKYIESQVGTLSPSTLNVYRSYRRNYLKTIMDCHVSDLTQDMVQLAISAESRKGLSPKSVRNIHGLLTVVLKNYRPKFVLNTRLPQKKKYEIAIPTEEEMKRIWKQAEGTKYELPILLASWLGLRMSEIRGLKYSDIQGNRIHIQRAIVYTADGDVEKGTKSFSGDRWIVCPQAIIDLINSKEHTSEYVCYLSEAAIYNGYQRLCRKAGIAHYRFHDLRHFAASEAHALGVPDKYQMKRMGHKTDNMLKNVYQHIMHDKEDRFAKLIDDHMQTLLS